MNRCNWGNSGIFFSFYPPISGTGGKWEWKTLTYIKEMAEAESHSPAQSRARPCTAGCVPQGRGRGSAMPTGNQRLCRLGNGKPSESCLQKTHWCASAQGRRKCSLSVLNESLQTSLPGWERVFEAHPAEPRRRQLRAQQQPQKCILPEVKTETQKAENKRWGFPKHRWMLNVCVSSGEGRAVAAAPGPGAAHGGWQRSRSHIGASCHTAPRGWSLRCS